MIGAVQGFSAWRRGLNATPAITSLRARAEAIRQAELARLEGQWEGLSEADRARVEALTKGIVNKLLHEPTVRVRAAAEDGDGDALRHLESLRHLFGLEAPANSRPCQLGTRPPCVRLILATRRSPLALAQTEHDRRRPCARPGTSPSCCPLTTTGDRWSAEAPARPARQGPVREGAGGGAARRARPPRRPLGQGPPRRAARRAGAPRRAAARGRARRGGRPRRRPRRPAGGRPRRHRQPAPRRPDPGGPARPRRSCRSAATSAPAWRSWRPGDADALILAAAGLRRLGLAPDGRHARCRSTSRTPAPGQGLLAVEGARRRPGARRRGRRRLDDPAAHACLRAERALLAALGGGCLQPVGGLLRARPRRPAPDRPSPQSEDGARSASASCARGRSTTPRASAPRRPPRWRGVRG